MDVHVVTHDNSHLYTRELDDFFRIRHDIYVDEKKWRDASADGYERDEFDTPDATYLIGFEDDRIICGSRFIETDRPHLLADVFGHLCTIETVRDPLVAEWTRGFIIPEFRERGGIRVKAQSCAAVMDYCLQRGYREVGGIQEAYWLPLWKRLGWQVRKVGAMALIDDVWCVPAYYSVTEQARDNARKWGGIETSNLVWIEAEAQRQVA